MPAVSMRHLDAELSGLLQAVLALSHKERLDLADLQRLSGLYTQAAYLCAYLEGNAKYIDAGVSLTVKAALLDDVELRGRLASRIQRLMAETDPALGRWTSAVKWFLQPPEQIRAETEMRAAMGGVDDVLTRVDRDRAVLLTRLGLGDGAGVGPAALAAALRSVTDPATRSKLLLAWQRVGKTNEEPLGEAMDRLVEQRWRHATAFGYRSVAERGFASCGVSAEAVRSFLEAYTDSALRERRVFLSRLKGAAALDDEVRALGLLPDLRDGVPGGGPAAIDLGPLLELVTDTVRSVFGITLSFQGKGAGTIACFRVTRGTDVWGTLALDHAVWGTSTRVLGSDIDLVVPDRPRARVLCLIERLDGSSESVSFEAARQILHAMGHALVHLATRPLAPSVSGLDILPLERLEGLSHWFEKLMDDDRFEDRVAVSLTQKAALKAFRRARDDWARNTRLEQAVVATIDLDIHERRGCRVQEAFDARIAAMGGPVGVSFERAVRFMTAPLFRDHPGMGFVYPWGAAFGASQALSVAGKRSPVPSLAAYFDPALVIPVPDAGAEFSSVTPSDSDQPRQPRVLPQ